MQPVDEFTVSVDRRDDAVIVAVSGELDVATAPELRLVLDDVHGAASAGSRMLIVDLSAVEFLDSTALGVLVSTLRRTDEAGGVFRVVVTHPHVLKVFRVTNLDHLMSVYATVDEALVDSRDAADR